MAIALACTSIRGGADRKRLLVLEYFGAFVTQAQSARDALQALQRVTPDVIIADIRLGDHNATWLVREARKVPVKAPVIAVSGLDFDERRLQEHGFAAYLRKPVGHDRLVDTVLHVVKRAA
jgi:two-component system OmpR family response regulator/two-component system response regulator QseB